MGMQDRARDANRDGGKPASAEMRRLRAQIRDQEQALHLLRAREQALAHLTAKASAPLFSFRLGKDGVIDVDRSGTSGEEDQPAFLDKEPAQQIYRRALEESQDRIVTFAETQETPRGVQNWEVALAPVPQEKVPVFAGVARRAVHQPAEVRQGHYQLIEALPEAVLIVGAGGTIRYANPAALRLAGVDKAEAVEGRPVWDFVLPEDQAHARERAQMLRRGLVVDYVNQDVLRADGAVVATETASVPIVYHGERAVLLTIHDLAEQRNMEKALAEAQNLFYGAFHLGPTALSISRIADGTFIDVNEQFIRLSGFNRDELVGQKASELNLWHYPEVRAQILQELEEQEALHEVEIEVRPKSGETRTVLASFQRFEASGGPYVLTNAIDITKRKHSEEVLRQAKEEAEEVARLRTALITNITHEFRTPLTVILGFTSMLQKSVRAEYRRFVRLIERSGRRLLLLLDSVLDLAQLEAGTLEVERTPLNLVDLVQNVVRTMEPLAEEKGLEFILTVPPEPAYASLDHQVFQRVLSNLLDNAIKFTEKGHVALDVEVNEETTSLHIIDTGVGISDAFLPHIFDEFAQESTGLERTHQGSGLGLSVSKRLIELIGGTIQVESRKEQGSVFTVTFPRA